MTDTEAKAKKAARDKRYYEKHKSKIIAKETAKKLLRDKTPQGKITKAKQAARYRQRHPERVAQQVASAHKKNPTRRRIATQRYRARKHNAFVEDISLDELFVRDNGVCQICGDPVSARTGKMRASMDHIVPLVLGGSHSYDNTQLAHFSCNSAKGSRV